MSVFDSPIARCEAVREMVLTDVTQAECARDHDCAAGQICPLCGFFVDAPSPLESPAATPAKH